MAVYVNLGHAEGISAVGELYHAAERGVIEDIFAAYGRLCRLVGRVVSDVEPMRQPHTATEWTPLGRPLLPLSQNRTTRLETLQACVGPAIRNATALDADRHWKAADAALKGFCLAEHLFWSELQAKAGEEAADYAEQGRDSDAEQAHRCADIRADKAAHFGRLLVSENW